MLKMLIMIENNNNIFKDGSNGELVKAHSDIIQNILGIFFKTNCKTCSSQNQMIPNISENAREKVAQIALIVIISCLVYANSLHGDFVHDDISAIVTNQDALGSSSIGSIFCNDFWGMNIRDRRSHKSYRPVTILTFR